MMTTTIEVAADIKKLKQKKPPGFDLITAEVLKYLPPKAIIKLTRIINACFRFSYVPSFWKISEMIMIPKPGKSTSEPSSYRPILATPNNVKAI